MPIDKVLTTPAEGEKRWLSLHGRPSPEMLEKLAKDFQLHRLALEDVIYACQA